jgi:putative DNA primase/helicase
MSENVNATNMDYDELPYLGDDVPDMDIDQSPQPQSGQKRKKRKKVEVSETLSSVIDDITLAYIDQIDRDAPPHPHEIEKELISRVNSAISMENLLIKNIPNGKDKNGNAKYVKERDRWPSLTRLIPLQIVRLIMTFHHVIRVDCAEDGQTNDEDLLGVYTTDPDHPNYGLYDISDSTLYNLTQQYDRQLGKLKFNEIRFILHNMSKRKTRCTKRDLVAVNNGIFNLKTKELEPFSPKRVYLAKSKVSYVDNPVNPVIVNPDDQTNWDVESWLETLSDDSEIVAFLWKVMSCIIRPFVRWNKAVWFYSTVGNNGKGTLCSLMRNLCGPGTHASIPLADFDKEFALQPLFNANAIIVDENNVGEYIDKSANLKAVITNDVISVNRKNKSIISFKFWGFMVQCVNELPRVRDKSDSFYRRQILIPFEKTFTGIERSYIKDDYLNRKEVLEYVLWKILNMEKFYTLEAPQKCLDLMGAYKNTNDPVRDFLGDFADKFVWDFVPTDFLYDLYIAWQRRFNPQGKPEGRTGFRSQIEQLVSNDPNSLWLMTPNPIHTNGKMDRPEPLILEYNLANWKNPNYIGKDMAQICVPAPAARTRGIVRRAIAPAAASASASAGASGFSHTSR